MSPLRPLLLLALPVGATVTVALGWALGAWIDQSLVAESKPILLATGAGVFALLQFGLGQVDEVLKGAAEALRSVQTPRTDKLAAYVARRRRLQTGARIVAGFLSLGAIAAAALLGLDALKTPEGNTNVAIARLVTRAGFASLGLQLFATAVALRGWMGAHAFEDDIRSLVRDEQNRRAYLATQRSPIPALADRPVPVTFSPAPVAGGGGTPLGA